MKKYCLALVLIGLTASAVFGQNVNATIAWSMYRQTNIIDDSVVTLAALTAANGYLSKPTSAAPNLMLRLESKYLSAIIGMPEPVKVTTNNLHIGRIRWDKEPPITVPFSLHYSNCFMVMPEFILSDIMDKLTTRKRLMVEVKLASDKTAIVIFTPPLEDPFAGVE